MKTGTYQYTDKRGVKGPVRASIPVARALEPSPVATWHELHTYRPGADLQANEAWMKEFSSRLPRGSCLCRGHWVDYLKKHPPDWSAAGWFAWTVQAHNAVNVRLGKAILTVEEAKRVWLSRIPVT